MDINKIVTEFYNPDICEFRGSVSAGEEADNCLADAKTYKLRFCRYNHASLIIEELEAQGATAKAEHWRDHKHAVMQLAIMATMDDCKKEATA
jgi:hypothetical protein